MSHNIMVTMHSSLVEVNDVGKSVPESGCQLEWYFSSPRLLVGEVCAKPSSHAGNDAAEPRLAMTWRCCRLMITMTLSGWLGRGVISMLSHVDDDTAEMMTLIMIRCGYLSLSPSGGRARSTLSTRTRGKLPVGQIFLAENTHAHEQACLMRG
jgi:hypothetical protein